MLKCLAPQLQEIYEKPQRVWLHLGFTTLSPPKEGFLRFHWYLLKPLFPQSASSVNSASWYSAWHSQHSSYHRGYPPPPQSQSGTGQRYYSNILSSLHKECLLWHTSGWRSPLEALTPSVAALSALINDCQNTGALLHCQTMSRILDTTSNLCLLEIPSRSRWTAGTGEGGIVETMAVNGSEVVSAQVVKWNHSNHVIKWLL